MDGPERGAASPGGVSTFSCYLLRATHLFIVVGLGL
jgi:hypothetical protein